MCRQVEYKPTEVRDVNCLTANPLKEMGMDALYYLGQLGNGWTVKLPVAAVASLYTTILGGDWPLLLAFYACTLLDLFFGARLAWKRGNFSIRRFGKWVVKLSTYSLCIVLTGLVGRGLNRASGLDIPILDLFLVVLLATEVLSIMNNMYKLGWPVPPLAIRLVADIHDKTAEKLTAGCGPKRPGRPERGDHDDTN